MPKLRRRSKEPASTLRRRLVRRFRASRIESHAPGTANRRGVGKLAHDLVVAGLRFRAVQQTTKAEGDGRQSFIAKRLRSSWGSLDGAFVEEEQGGRVFVILTIERFEKLVRDKLALEGELIPLMPDDQGEPEPTAAPEEKGEVDGVRLRILG